MKNVALVTVLTFCLLGGCLPSNKQLVGMKSDSAALRADLRANNETLATIEDPVERAALIAANKAIEKQVGIIDDAIQGAKNSQGATDAFWDSALTVAGGFLPPLLLLGPWVRALRRQRRNIFRAVDAGGGVKNPEPARKLLMRDRQAHFALQRHQNSTNKLATH